MLFDNSTVKSYFLDTGLPISHSLNIHPVKVNVWKNTTYRSLDKSRSKYADWLDSPCLLWDKDLKVKGGITYLPLHMAPMI